MCNTAYILGVYKVSLQQVRYTFRHDTVLHKIIKSLKSFILNINQAAPISPKSSIKFVKMGTKVPCKRTSRAGISHQASDWVLLVDLDSNYCFPIHIAFTQLRPDILHLSMFFFERLYSLKPGHSTKINKYLALKVTIESNGWSVKHFAVEVGARDIALLFCVASKTRFQ